MSRECAAVVLPLKDGDWQVWCWEHGGEQGRWRRREKADRSAEVHRRLHRA